MGVGLALFVWEGSWEQRTKYYLGQTQRDWDTRPLPPSMDIAQNPLTYTPAGVFPVPMRTGDPRSTPLDRHGLGCQAGSVGGWEAGGGGQFLLQQVGQCLCGRELHCRGPDICNILIVPPVQILKTVTICSLV